MSDYLNKKVLVGTGIIIMLTLIIIPFLSRTEAAGARDCDTNAVIYCGTLTKDELTQKINNGDGIHTDIKSKFSTLGISTSSIPNLVDGYVNKDGTVTVGGKQVATGVKSAGRSNMAGSTYSNGLYWRPPSVSFLSTSISAFVSMSGNNFNYAILKSCGNPVFPPVTPPTTTTTTTTTKKPPTTTTTTTKPKTTTTTTTKPPVTTKSTTTTKPTTTTKLTTTSTKPTTTTKSTTTTTKPTTTTKTSTTTTTTTTKPTTTSKSTTTTCSTTTKSSTTTTKPTTTSKSTTTCPTTTVTTKPKTTTTHLTTTTKPKIKIVIKKYEDANLNGTPESNEEWLSGWTFEISGLNFSRLVTTGAGGTVTVGELIPGQYLIREQQREGWGPDDKASLERNLICNEEENTVLFGNYREKASTTTTTTTTTIPTTLPPIGGGTIISQEILPVTGPLEIIAGTIGTVSLGGASFYYARTRKILKKALKKK